MLILMKAVRKDGGRATAVAGALVLALLLLPAAAELAMRAAGGRLRFLEERASAGAGWERAPERILCLGESTTAPTDRPDHSWPRQLEEILNAGAGERRNAVINAGRSSTNSAVLLARLPGLLDQYAPRTVVVMMGVNDSRWYGVLETAARRSGGWRGALARLRVWKLARYVRYELLRGTLLVRRRAPRPPLAPELSRECVRLLSAEAEDARTERACLQAVEADPEDWASHSGLTELYRARGRHGEAEKVLRRSAARAPSVDWPRVLLAETLLLQDKAPEAETLLWEVLRRSSDPDMVNRVLLSLDGVYRSRGRPELIGEAYRQVVAFETRGAQARTAAAGVSPATTVNYRLLREMLRERGIRLVAVQYPTLPAAALRAVFPDPEGVLFVENRDGFSRALREGGYGSVFRDRSFGGWGHCTAAGDRLIAESVARAIGRSPAPSGSGPRSTSRGPLRPPS